MLYPYMCCISRLEYPLLHLLLSAGFLALCVIHLCVVSLCRLEDPLLHLLLPGWLLALSDPDRLLLSVDVLDVPQQRLPLHVGRRAHPVSAVPGESLAPSS